MECVCGYRTSALAVPQSRSPALEKKKNILHGYRTSAPAVPHSAHGL